MSIQLIESVQEPVISKVGSSNVKKQDEPGFSCKVHRHLVVAQPVTTAGQCAIAPVIVTWYHSLHGALQQLLMYCYHLVASHS